MAAPRSVDDYIAAAAPAAQPFLREIRGLVLAAAPAAVELIRYGMPTYDLAGRRFLNFAAATRHVALYGLVHVDAPVPPDLAPYLGHRSTLTFRFDRPLPSAALEAAMRGKAQSFAG